MAPQAIDTCDKAKKRQTRARSHAEPKENFLLRRSFHDLQSLHHIQRGITLIEVMVTIGVLSILLGISVKNFVPSFSSFSIQPIISGFESAIYLARTESLRRGGNISVSFSGCKEFNDGTCEVEIKSSDGNSLHSIKIDEGHAYTEIDDSNISIGRSGILEKDINLKIHAKSSRELIASYCINKTLQPLIIEGGTKISQKKYNNPC